MARVKVRLGPKGRQEKEEEEIVGNLVVIVTA
jgi:hypothetical protein